MSKTTEQMANDANEANLKVNSISLNEEAELTDTARLAIVILNCLKCYTIAEATGMMGFQTVEYVESALEKYDVTFNVDVESESLDVEFPVLTLNRKGGIDRYEHRIKLYGMQGVGGIVFSTRCIMPNIDEVKRILDVVEYNNNVIADYVNSKEN